MLNMNKNTIIKIIIAICGNYHNKNNITEGDKMFQSFF